MFKRNNFTYSFCSHVLWPRVGVIISQMVVSQIFFNQIAHADTDALDFIFGVSYQQKTLSFDQQYRGAAQNSAQFDVTLPVANFEFAGVYKRSFFKIKYERSAADVSTTADETDRSLLGQANLLTIRGTRLDVNRGDISITFGWNVWRRMNIFAGYLSGETRLRPAPACGNVSATGQDCLRSNRAFFQYILGGSGLVDDQPEYKQAYSEKGPFFGMSYGWLINDWGSVSASFAYAHMDGQFDDNANDPDNFYRDTDGLPTFVPFDYRGDTLGTSIGLTWTGQLGGSTAYTIDLRRQSYKMEGDDASGRVNFSDVYLETEERMLGLSAGVQVYF